MQTESIGTVTTTFLGEHRQMVLPEKFCESLDLEPGAPISLLQFGNQMILIPTQTQFGELSDAIATKLEQLGLTEEELLAGLAETREELARERYPELFADEPTLSAASVAAGVATSVGTSIE